MDEIKESKKMMKIALTKELKAELLLSLKRGYIDRERLNELTGRNKVEPSEVTDEQLKAIEKILYPD